MYYMTIIVWICWVGLNLLNPPLSFGEITRSHETSTPDELDDFLIDEKDLKYLLLEETPRNPTSQPPQPTITTDTIHINKLSYNSPIYINMLWAVDRHNYLGRPNKLIEYVIKQLAASSHNIHLRFQLIGDYPVEEITVIKQELNTNLQFQLQKLNNAKLEFTIDKFINRYMTLQGTLKYLVEHGYENIFAHSRTQRSRNQRNIIVFITKENSKHYPPPLRGGFLSHFFKIATFAFGVVASGGATLAASALFTGASTGIGAVADRQRNTSANRRIRQSFEREIQNSRYALRPTAEMASALLKTYFNAGEFQQNSQEKINFDLEIWSIVGDATTESYADSPELSETNWKLSVNGTGTGQPQLMKSSQPSNNHPVFTMFNTNAQDRVYNNHNSWKKKVGIEDNNPQEVFDSSCLSAAPTRQNCTYLCEFDYLGFKNSPATMADLAQNSPRFHAYLNDPNNIATFNKRRRDEQSTDLSRSLPNYSLVQPEIDEPAPDKPTLSSLTFINYDDSQPQTLTDLRIFVNSTSLNDLSPQQICDQHQDNPASFAALLEDNQMNPRPQCLRFCLTSRPSRRSPGCKKRKGDEYIKLAKMTRGLTMTPCAAQQIDTNTQAQELIKNHLTSAKSLLKTTSRHIKLRHKAKSIIAMNFEQPNSNIPDKNMQFSSQSSVVKKINDELTQINNGTNDKSMLVNHQGGGTVIYLHFDHQDFITHPNLADLPADDKQSLWDAYESEFGDFKKAFVADADQSNYRLTVDYAKFN